LILIKIKTPLKSFPTFILLLLFVLPVKSQTITGKVTDAVTGEPLVYVSIGVMATPIGTISDEKGNFSFEIKEQPPDALVRFSMIGYKAQTFSIAELTSKENAIKLKIEPVELAKVDIKFGKIKKVGNTKFSRKTICGWVGDEFGKGYEIGTKIDLGSEPVLFYSLHIRIATNSFDSSLFRLHIRDIIDSLPHNELLSENILIVLTKKSGWVDIDLRKYNLIYSGEIVLTLEWLKVIGINENRLIWSNKFELYGPEIDFSTTRNGGVTFGKKGVEAKWIKSINESASFYLTVQE